jgi:hypothetical protein
MTDTWADGATLRQRLDDHFDAHFHDRLDIQDKARVARGSNPRSSAGRRALLRKGLFAGAGLPTPWPCCFGIFWRQSFHRCVNITA